MKVIKYIFLYGQLIFAIMLTIWAVVMLLRCIINGSDTFYWLCFVAMAVNGWFLLIKPSWHELKEEKGGKQ